MSRPTPAPSSTAQCWFPRFPAYAFFELRQPRNFDGVGVGLSGASLEAVQILLKDGFD